MNVSLPVKTPTPGSDLSLRATPWAGDAKAIRTVIDTGSDDPQSVRTEVAQHMVSHRETPAEARSPLKILTLAAAAVFVVSRMLR